MHMGVSTFSLLEGKSMAYIVSSRPMGWIYPSEIIPLYIRSKAVSLASLFNWACTFSLTFFTPPAFQNIQWRTYMIFGSFCVAASFHVFFFFQESRCKTLEEMSFIFENNTFACGKIEKPRIQNRLDQFEGEKGACEPSTESMVVSKKLLNTAGQL